MTLVQAIEGQDYIIKDIVSDDEELYRLAEGLPDFPLYYEMQTAEPQQITKEAIYPDEGIDTFNSSSNLSSLKIIL